jgi:hypothetical protein
MEAIRKRDPPFGLVAEHCDINNVIGVSALVS